MGTFDRNMVFETALEAMSGVDPARRDQLLIDALVVSVARSRQLLDLEPRNGTTEVLRVRGQHVAVPA